MPAMTESALHVVDPWNTEKVVAGVLLAGAADEDSLAGVDGV